MNIVKRRFCYLIGIDCNPCFIEWHYFRESINIFINLYDEFGSAAFYAGRVGNSRPSNIIYYNFTIYFE